jgi:hypothetical protein
MPDAITSGVLTEAEANLSTAASYHVVATGLTCDSFSPIYAHPRLDADLTVLRSGDLTGTASIVTATNHQPFTVTRVGGQIYVRGRSLWDWVDPPSASRYGDSWVSVGAFTDSHPDPALFHHQLWTIMCIFNGVPDTLARFTHALAGDAKVSDTAFQGRPAIAVRSPSDSSGAPVSVVVVGPPALPAVVIPTAALRSSFYGYGVFADGFTIDGAGAPASVSAPSTSLSAG